MAYFKFGKISRSVLNLLFPKKCLSCGQEGGWLCQNCIQKIKIYEENFCPSCQVDSENGKFCLNCQKYYRLDGAIICSQFQNPLKEVIHYFKYNKILELAEPLANILISKLEQGLPEGDLILIPIPLHPNKLRERGFNQSEILAKKIAQVYDLPLLTEILVKIKDTPSQFSLKRKERRENIKGAFEVRGKGKNIIRNKLVLLLDDVMTTGATLNEAAKMLKQTGAGRVWGVVLAKG